MFTSGRRPTGCTRPCPYACLQWERERICSESNLSHGPAIWATEQMLGHAATLMSDLSRAPYIVLLSGEQRDLGWGAFSPAKAMRNGFSIREKQKNPSCGRRPRKTTLADTMDKYVAIRPGSQSC